MNALKRLLLGAVRWNEIAEDGTEHSPEQRLSMGGAPHGAAKRVRHGLLILTALLRLFCRSPGVASTCVVGAEECENKIGAQFHPMAAG